MPRLSNLPKMRIFGPLQGWVSTSRTTMLRSPVTGTPLVPFLSYLRSSSCFSSQGTVGFSGAELANLINQAALQASRQEEDVITLATLEWAKDKILMGAERKKAVITEHDRKVTAYHEGGHALCALYAEGAVPVYKATIVPRGNALGTSIPCTGFDCAVCITSQEATSCDLYLTLTYWPTSPLCLFMAFSCPSTFSPLKQPCPLYRYGHPAA